MPSSKRKRIPVTDWIEAANEINYLHHKVEQIERAYAEHRESYQRLRQRVVNLERKTEELKSRDCGSCEHPLAFHYHDSCGFIIDRGHPSRDIVCTCTITGSSS